MGKILATLATLIILSPFTQQAINKYVWRLNAKESAGIAYVDYGVGRNKICTALYGPGAGLGHLLFYNQDLLNNTEQKPWENAAKGFNKILHRDLF